MSCAHELITAHARSTGVDAGRPEFQRFARELFQVGRQCGANGLGDESRRLMALARLLNSAVDMRVYDFVIGWRRTGRAAA
jgi:hypothetical protein